VSQQSSQFASQAVEHVRTVSALGQLGRFVDDYKTLLVAPSNKLSKAALVELP
jgi:hypothetical protein